MNKSTNTFSKGLDLSYDYVNQPKDTYSYALNAVKEDSVNNPSIITNEKGFNDYIDLGYRYILLGSIYFGREDYILFIKNLSNDTAFNRIVLIENKKITVKLDLIDLGFNEKYLIKGTYRINYKNERIIYWVDGLNEDRVFNIDNNISIDTVDELSIDIKYVPGVLSSKNVNDNNGNLKTGSYEFFASYKSKDNATTPWFLLNANPVYIIKDDVESSEYINIIGSDSNIITTKSIELNIANLDTNFNTIRLGVLKTINGVKYSTYIDNIGYIGTTKDYTYSGFAEELELANESEFIIEPVRYYASNAITQSSGRLLRANTKQSKINIDYQSFANNIITDYYVQEEQVLTMPDSTDDSVRDDWWKSAITKYTDTKSLLRDEVVSVGVSFGLKKEGSETLVYHIPGRQIDSVPNTTYESEYDDTFALYSNNWDSQAISDNGEIVPRWKIHNTAAKSSDGVVKKLGYYESTEVYPSGYGLPTGNVRHHRVPSSGLEPIYRSEKIGGNIIIYKRNIGLSFSNISIPDELKDNVSYIRIYITPRNIDKNKSIVGKGIFVNCSLTNINSGSQDTVSSNKWVYPVQPYNDLTDIMNAAPYKQEQSSWDTKNNYYHSFYSPDTLFKKPSLNTDRVYIENEISGTVHYYNTVASKISADPHKKGYKDTPSNSNGGYKRDIFYDTGNLIPVSQSQTSSGDVYNVANTFRSTYKSICIFNNIEKVHRDKSSRKIKKSVYVPFNAKLTTDQLGGMDNPYYSPYGSSNVLIELNTLYPNLGETETLDDSVKFTDNNSAYVFPDDSETKNKTIKGTFHFHPIKDATAVYRYGSIKRNNPAQYGEIIGLEYAPTDVVISNPSFTNNILTRELKGLIGDSWIDIFSLKRVRYGSKKDYSYGSLPEVHVGVSSFFTESTVNHRLRYADAQHSIYPQIIQSFGIKTYLDYSNKSIVEDDNYYKYNEDYTIISSKRNYSSDEVDKDVSTIVDYSTRVVYSEKLLDESRIDSYRTFLANNYKDLPKNKGFITHLFTKGRELYAITRDSIWRLFASSARIESSEDDLTVGTGEFLSLDPIELVSIDGGFAGSSSKASLVETPYGYFFVDRYKGKFILFTGEVTDISMKGINQFIVDNFKLFNIKEDSDFDLPLIDQGYVAGYDPELKRLLVTKLDFKLSQTDIPNYKGEFNETTLYQPGDIYTRNGKYYRYVSKSQQYQTLVESNNLSDFIDGGNDALQYTYTSNPNITKDGNNNLVYNSPEVKQDNINITMGCSTTPITINVLNAPTLPDYITTVEEQSVNGKEVIVVNGDYPNLTYTILSGNELGIFSIDNNGRIIVANNTNLLVTKTSKVILDIRAQAGDLYDDGKVTINITEKVTAPIGVDKTITILNTAVGQITTIEKASWNNYQVPKPSLIYEQLTDTDFISDLDQEDNMTLSLKDGVILDPSIENSYLIQFRVYNSNDETLSDTFNITINVLYDPAKLVAEPYEYTCLIDPIYESNISLVPYKIYDLYNQMRSALPPLNDKGHSYAYKSSTTGHGVYSIHFLFYDEEGSSQNNYYAKNAFGDHVIGTLDNPDTWPSTTIKLYGYSRDKSLGGYITPNGDIHLNSCDEKAIINCSGMVNNYYVMRLYNVDYASEFTEQGREI